MGAALIITLIILIGLAVGGYFLYNKLTSMYFSESFIFGEDEYAYQDLDKFDKFKDKLNEIEENDSIKFIKSIIDKNKDIVYPKLKNGYVIIWKCGRDTSFSKINKDLLMGNFDYSLSATFMYNKDKNMLQQIVFQENGTIVLNELKDTISEVKSFKDKLISIF